MCVSGAGVVSEGGGGFVLAESRGWRGGCGLKSRYVCWWVVRGREGGLEEAVFGMCRDGSGLWEEAVGLEAGAPRRQRQRR